MTVPLVTLEVCRVRARDVAALVVSGRRAVRARRREPAVLLAKLLATTGRRFQPRDVRLARWALLTCRADGAPAAAWAPANAAESGTLQLRPIASRGSWDGADPFPLCVAADATGAVAVLTRASLRATQVRRFYADVPAIAAEIETARPRLAFGFGEAPVLRQGTFSMWESADALTAFHRDARAHGAAMRATPQIGWYAEDLFARFAVVGGHGSIDGVAFS